MQAPYWSQGLNRYSYVFNNPVNNTDPTGFVTGNDAAAMYAPFHVPAMTTMGALGSGLGFATGPLSVGTTLLGGGAGFGQAGGTYNAAVSRAAVGSGTGQGGTHATAQNRGGVVAQAGGPLPRYAGGAPGTGVGGHEGAGGGPPADPTERPGRFLKKGASGMYALSAHAGKHLLPIFAKLGYSLGRTQVRFAPLSGGDHAFTLGDTITIDPTIWNNSKPRAQLRLLAHEITHSAQFQRLGRIRTQLRVAWENLTNSLDELYDVPGALHRTPLKNLDVTDGRFTLEAIAEHVANHVKYP